MHLRFKSFNVEANEVKTEALLEENCFLKSLSPSRKASMSQLFEAY